MPRPRSQSSSGSSSTTSAAHSSYHTKVLSKVYAQFIIAKASLNQLPKALAVALGSSRLALLPSTTSQDGQQTSSAEQDISERSIDDLAETITIAVDSEDAAEALESWWNSAVWGMMYGKVMVTHPDLKVLCVKRLW